MASGRFKGQKEIGKIVIVLFCVFVTSNLAPTSFSCPRDAGDAQETLQLLCVDAEGKHLEGANVTIQVAGAVVYSGLTNSTGWISTSVPGEPYVARVFWVGVPVFSKEFSATGPTTVTAQCDVYHLTLAINLLYIIPVRHAHITIMNAISGRVVAGYAGEVNIPYGFYRLSAETTFRLPPGSYVAVVEMLNSQSQNLTLKDSKRVVFAYVMSWGSVFILACIFMAVVSCIGFLVAGRKRRA